MVPDFQADPEGWPSAERPRGIRTPTVPLLVPTATTPRKAATALLLPSEPPAGVPMLKNSCNVAKCRTQALSSMQLRWCAYFTFRQTRCYCLQCRQVRVQISHISNMIKLHPCPCAPVKMSLATMPALTPSKGPGCMEHTHLSTGMPSTGEC